MNQRTIGLFALLAWGGSLGFAADGISPKSAFEKLKSLAGRWEGHVVSPDGPEGAVEYRVSSAGTLLSEVLFPGTDHEMVSVYFLDGEDLRGKHFCVMGNQPEMKLDPKTSNETELHFSFTGGTNLDPAKDAHMHGGKISILGDRLESEWTVYNGGKQEGANRFFLSRVKD
jgi:hypothetical protein